jgi:hypothetical protein
MQSDAAALPYQENLIKGLNRIGQILLDLIPKYYVTPRSIPIRKANGLRDYKVINDPTNEQSIDLVYDSNELQIKIEAGVNSAMQKKYALDQLARVAEAFPGVAQMINDVGLDIVVDNLDIQRSEELKERTSQYMQQKANAPQKPDPIEMAIQVEQERNRGQLMNDAEKIKQKREEYEGKQAVQTAELAIKEQEAHINYVKVLNELEEKNRRLAMDENAHDTALSQDALNISLDIAKSNHEMSMREKEHELSVADQQAQQAPEPQPEGQPQ